VLILDEPTAGLDPKQIHETRDLIRSLAGAHTIILSTHILPEVEQTCDHVVIISKGKVVARDSVQNLTSRLRGQEAVSVAVAGAEVTAIQQKLEQTAGVARVVVRDSHQGLSTFEVESLAGQNVRASLAKTVVEAGWELHELHTAARSLEEVFLELTSVETVAQEAQHE